MEFACSKKTKKVYVLDCGGQYAHLIASRVRSHHAFSAIVHCDVAASDIAHDAGAIIVSGGPQSVFDPESLKVDKAIWDLPVPILGVCASSSSSSSSSSSFFSSKEKKRSRRPTTRIVLLGYGCQLMCQDLGGDVAAAAVGEYGPAKISLAGHAASAVLPASAEGTVVWMSHRDRVMKLPPGFVTTATTAHCPHAALEKIDGPRKLFGVQFHPEVTHTEAGTAMLGAFVDVAGLRDTWRVNDFVESQMAAIRAKCADRDRSVFVLVSGGVDSTVVYALLAKALPREKILGLYIDTGMMRKDESAFVEAELQKAGLPNLRCVDASARFLRALEGATAPEAKRRIIGQQFLEVQKEQVALLNLDPAKWLLGQGTIYPDTIESGGKHGRADVIKTHHNRVPEIEALISEGLVIEPLAELYKDEAIGLAHHLVWRQPFPGPGLGVRLLCHDADPEPAEEKEARLAAAREVMRNHPAFCRSVDVPPLRSVGCQGDSRTYRNFAVLFPPFPKDWARLGDLATKVVNESALVNRVCVSLCDDAPPSAFEVSPGAPHTVTRARLDALRDADAIVTAELLAHDVNVWQCPVVMAPLAPAGATGPSEVIIIRPVDSTEAMTASFSQIPWTVCKSIADKIRAQNPKIVNVLYDITNKPPGTIEFE